jgi:hypothetical protein
MTVVIVVEKLMGYRGALRAGGRLVWRPSGLTNLQK